LFLPRDSGEPDHEPALAVSATAVSLEMVRPTGRFSSLSEALGAFEATGAEVIRRVEECTDGHASC
jgi:hypothetical protein